MTAPSGDWPALARAVRNRRRHLGIPTQAAAAHRAGISPNSWQRLEAGTPVSDTTLAAAAVALGWEPGTPMEILTGRPVTEPEPRRTSPLLSAERPALVYHATDGTLVRLDRDDLTTLPARERALCAALLDHARDQLNQAGISAIAYHGAHIPVAHDHQDGPTP